MTTELLVNDGERDFLACVRFSAASAAATKSSSELSAKYLSAALGAIVLRLGDFDRPFPKLPINYTKRFINHYCEIKLY